MDIKNIYNNINSQVNGAGPSEGSGKSDRAASSTKNSYSDKVSLNEYSRAKNEKLFAKIELEKLNTSSFDRLKEFKAKLNEYETALKESPDKAAETDIGKMLENPEVWESIATKIVD